MKNAESKIKFCNKAINTSYFLPITYYFKYAGVAELADALDLGSSVFDVQVQVLSPAPNENPFS